MLYKKVKGPKYKMANWSSSLCFLYMVDLGAVPFYHIALIYLMQQEKNPRFRESGDSDDDEEDDRKRQT